jgi:hypothetical protein
MNQVVAWSKDANALLVVGVAGVLLTWIGVLIAWLVYRGGKASQRKGVIAALRQELTLHAMWARGPYTKGVTQPEQEWWRRYSPRGTVFKLTTVATDSAIANGPDLFLNRQLLVALVEYRQVVNHFNQLVDRAMCSSKPIRSSSGSGLRPDSRRGWSNC